MRPGPDPRISLAFPRMERQENVGINADCRAIPDSRAASYASTQALLIEAARNMRALIDTWLDLWLRHPWDPQAAGRGQTRHGRTSPFPSLDAQALEGGDAVLTAVAHELRTPLTTIRSISEILQDNPELTSDQREQFLDALVAESKRLQDSVDRLLEASTANPERWCVETARLRHGQAASPPASRQLQ